MSSPAQRPRLEEDPARDLTEIAERVSAELAATAVARDRAGGTAKAERDLLRRSGLLGLSIPTAFGGAGASWADTMRVVRRLARVDGSIAHLFGFHHLLVATVRLFGDERQWSEAYTETVRRDWFWGNALNPLDRRTTIGVGATAGSHVVDGTKSFCSGARDSDRLVVSALDAQGQLVVAVLPSDRAGIQIRQDWDNMGQRQTDSGTVVLERVVVRDDEILRSPGPLGSPFASLRPCLAQLVLANVFLGLGEGALEEARRYTLEQARPWQTSGVTATSDDPYLLRHYGELWVGLQAAVALTDAGGAALDRAWTRAEALTAPERGACAVAIAAAKVATTRAGLDVANRMFEVAGARATSAQADLDRFWRNLRTHTLHDPVDYKLRELGRFALLGELPTPSFYS
jgi:alkylation response protein AidB-like acyl-CoA dehydrogenase